MILPLQVNVRTLDMVSELRSHYPTLDYRGICSTTFRTVTVKNLISDRILSPCPMLVVNIGGYIFMKSGLTLWLCALVNPITGVVAV